MIEKIESPNAHIVLKGPKSSVRRKLSPRPHYTAPNSKEWCIYSKVQLAVEESNIIRGWLAPCPLERPPFARLPGLSWPLLILGSLPWPTYHVPTLSSDYTPCGFHVLRRRCQRHRRQSMSSPLALTHLVALAHLQLPS